jgi:hypothetical protein
VDRAFPPDVIVVREVPWREEEGRVVILAPRFSESFFGRLQRRLFGDSTVKIKLDDLGTHAWKAFDGTSPIVEIAASLEEAFGEKAESALDRLDLFLGELVRNGWVSCHQKVSPETDEEEGVKENAELQSPDPIEARDEADEIKGEDGTG